MSAPALLVSALLIMGAASNGVHKDPAAPFGKLHPASVSYIKQSLIGRTLAPLFDGLHPVERKAIRYNKDGDVRLYGDLVPNGRWVIEGEGRICSFYAKTKRFCQSVHLDTHKRIFLTFDDDQRIVLYRFIQ